MLFPLLLRGKKGIAISLLASSLLIPAFLVSLEAILNMGKIITPIGLPIAAISLLYLWIVYGLFRFAPWSRTISACLTLLLTIPLTLGVNALANWYTSTTPTLGISDFISCVFLAILAIAVFVVSKLRASKPSAQ